MVKFHSIDSDQAEKYNVWIYAIEQSAKKLCG